MVKLSGWLKKIKEIFSKLTAVGMTSLLMASALSNPVYAEADQEDLNNAYRMESDSVVQADTEIRETEQESSQSENNGDDLQDEEAAEENETPENVEEAESGETLEDNESADEDKRLEDSEAGEGEETTEENEIVEGNENINDVASVDEEELAEKDENQQEMEQEDAERGMCGENVSFVFDRENRILTLTGEGQVADYKDMSEVPWGKYLEDIETVEIEQGVLVKLWMINRKAAEKAGKR